MITNKRPSASAHLSNLKAKQRDNDLQACKRNNELIKKLSNTQRLYRQEIRGIEITTTNPERLEAYRRHIIGQDHTVNRGLFACKTDKIHQRHDWIEQQRKSGRSYVHIAKSVDMSPATLSKYCRKFGITP